MEMVKSLFRTTKNSILDYYGVLHSYIVYYIVITYNLCAVHKGAYFALVIELWMKIRGCLLNWRHLKYVNVDRLKKKSRNQIISPHKSAKWPCRKTKIILLGLCECLYVVLVQFYLISFVHFSDFCKSMDCMCKSEIKDGKIPITIKSQPHTSIWAIKSQKYR